MTDLQVGIYFICFAIVAGASFAFMFKMMTTTLEEFNKPVQRSNVHPEMSDVQSGEELLVFKASLEEEDDDDEGDVVVIRK
ncbi:MAG: hypothetical protein CM15mV36_1630 [Caudoviricetes sp.]|nr:MAG: hypothetical protein CM15mV36_1630 [Caudoviricetes sp.]